MILFNNVSDDSNLGIGKKAKLIEIYYLVDSCGTATVYSRRSKNDFGDDKSIVFVYVFDCRSRFLGFGQSTRLENVRQRAPSIAD